MPAVDTNILVRLIVRDDPAQTRRAEEFIAGGAWVSALVLTEAVWVLDTVYSLPPTALATAIGMLLQHRQLVIQEYNAVEAALALFQAKPKLGFSDCLLLELAREAGQLPLGTFDRRLATLNGVQKL